MHVYVIFKVNRLKKILNLTFFFFLSYGVSFEQNGLTKNGLAGISFLRKNDVSWENKREEKEIEQLSKYKPDT